MYQVYDLYGEFDLEQHVAHYYHYLEVVILPDGTVEYAVPSHQEKLIQIYLNDHPEITRSQLYDMCPDSYTFDVISWLCSITGCVSVWTNYITFDTMTLAQRDSLHKLESAGAYEGTLNF